MKKTLLIDADTIIYKVYKLLEVNNNDYKVINNYINSILKNSGANDLVLVFSSSNNFRYDFLKSYKHNRKRFKNSDNDLIKKYMINNYESLEIDGLEADDVLGIYMTNEPDKYIMCSIDKDLKQIPGILYNPDTKETINITKEDALNYLKIQMIKGDAGDGYYCIAGIGDKMMPEIFERCEKSEKGFFKELFEVYKYFGYDYGYFLKMFRVCKILDNRFYNLEKLNFEITPFKL